nr:TnsD family transposase [Desulforamulus aeronauticus]
MYRSNLKSSLGFFPTPYPDEILYSVFARYHIRSGNTSPKATLRDLFGNTNATAILDLPCNIENLISNMPACWNYGADELIYKHSLYPFYSPFLPEERATRLLLLMMGSYGGSAHAMTGILASTVVTPRYLRFCPSCLTEDKSSYGELYWHRLHQVPGVIVCPHHGHFLLDSSVSVHGQNKHEFISSSKENCQNYNVRTCFDKNVFPKFIDLALDIRQLLNMKGVNIETANLKELYLSKLKDRGLATSTGRVYQEDLAKEFVSFYGIEFLRTVYSPVKYHDPNCWLAAIVRKHRKSFHPIRHLLMIKFLGGSIKWLKGFEFRLNPFGLGPWPCLNAAARHYLEPMVSEIALSHCADTKRPVGTFTCSCGFVYSRRGPDQRPEDRHKIGRIKAFGIVWEQRLKELVEQEKLSLREVARRLKVDPMTVKKYAGILGLTYHWKTKTTESLNPVRITKNDQEDKRDKYRKDWYELRRHHNQASKTELRKLAPRTYIWLYRHDKEWLNQNSPYFRANKQENMRVNWLERDKEVLLKVKKAVSRIKVLDDKPVRISISRIGKLSGTLSLLEKHLDKMPLTKEFLKNNYDTTEEYQIRRIKWAVRKINLAGEQPKAWKVSRMSGLRPEFSHKLRSDIEQSIDVCIKRDWVEYGCLNLEIGPLGLESYQQ